MSNLPNYNNLAIAKFTPDSDESIRNNNVLNKEQEIFQQQQIQQQQQQQRQMQQPYDPPYLIRHSRAFRHFKNPPQPHMCIKDHTDDGQELFINVMSWTKICMPHSDSDPIPLYGGMRVTSGSPKSPPLIFAVMANPAILKHVGRKCSDMEEKYALVKLMCDFVEAMNPGLKLARDAEVLKDRDLSGELKDIWGAVQAKRLREKDSAPSYESYLATQNQIYIDFGPSDAPPYQIDKTYDNQKQQQLIQPNIIQAQRNNINSNKECKNQSNSILNVDEVDNMIDGHQNTFNQNDFNMQTNRSNIENKDAQSSKKSTQHDKHIESDTVNKNDRQITKKDKLSGFLPNGCHNIFPFIKTKTSSSHDKNQMHKDKNDTIASNQKDQSQLQSNGTRKITTHNNKNNNKLIVNKDTTTTNIESELSKLDIGKSH